MKKLLFFLVSLLITIYEAHSIVIVNPQDIMLTGDTNLLSIREVEVINFGEAAQSIVIKMDTNFISISPVKFELKPDERKKVLLFLMMPPGTHNPYRTRVQVENGSGEDLSYIDVFFNGKGKDNDKLDFEHPQTLPPAPLTIDSGNVSLAKKLDTLQLQLMSMETEMQKKEKDMMNLKDEIHKKDLQLVVLTNKNNKDFKEMQYKKLPVFKPDEQDTLPDSRLNDLYKTLREKLDPEINNHLAAVTWRDLNLCITLAGKISFISGSAYLRLDGENLLKKICVVLNENKNVKYKIMAMGHTDANPVVDKSNNDFTNWELSALRSAKIVRCLEESGGIAGKNLYCVGNSSYHPISDNSTAKGRIDNRRIELIISILND